ncbi:carbohydrate sulfotransferase 14-like isoform X2 [Mya arenaria]|uniref:carbohydrate sulfotransferase 14-like isoform X2 n=1 Tax=Mya arenaria TaxID=6604 RepID=UPI0022E00A8A|nr:carbohydrate sulfotransferase 14-like isoform X2 [Mya arenaria]
MARAPRRRCVMYVVVCGVLLWAITRTAIYESNGSQTSSRRQRTAVPVGERKSGNMPASPRPADMAAGQTGNSVSDEMAARKHKVNQECRGYEVYNIHASKLNFLDQAPKKDRRRLLDKYKKFTFVRDPLSRLLSGYRNKFFHPNSVNREEFYNFVKTYYKLHHERKTMRKMRTNFIKGPITFKEFVTYILDCFETNDYVNEHFVPAYLLIQPCRVKYDYIGKFETIHTDTQHIFTELNIDISFPGRQDNYSSVATDTLVWSYYERLPVAMLKGLLDVFMPDFILFGYKVPDWIHDRIRNVTIH